MTRPEPKTIARSVLMWAFGMTVSILLIAMWGRAVVIDTDTLAESLSPLSESGLVVDFLTDWMGDQLDDSGITPNPALNTLLDSSSVSRSLDQFVVEVVRAAASTSPGGSSVDMAALAAPAVPELTIALASLGYQVSEAEVSALVAGFEPLTIRGPGTGALIGPASPAVARLGMAVLLAGIGLVVFGAGVIRLSEDRIAAVRLLVTRIAVGGLSFAVLLRLGSWVLDPNGGRAPVPATLSALAGSKWLVPLQVAVVAGVIAGGIYVVRRWLRREEVSQSPDGQPIPQSEPREPLSGRR